VSASRVTPYELEPQVTDNPDHTLVSVAGELDLTNAGDFEERIQALMAPSGSSLFLDLRRVAFIDSAALHVLFKMADRLGKSRFGLVFEPESAITRTLEIVGVHDIATIGGSVDELSAALS
jgi:anti-anti-sigma factor